MDVSHRDAYAMATGDVNESGAAFDRELGPQDRATLWANHCGFGFHAGQLVEGRVDGVVQSTPSFRGSNHPSGSLLEQSPLQFSQDRTCSPRNTSWRDSNDSPLRRRHGHSRLGHRHVLVSRQIAIGIWRHVVRRVPLRYHPACWTLVVPIGMYGAATHGMIASTDLDAIDVVPQLALGAALIAWTATFVGLLVSLLPRRRVTVVERLEREIGRLQSNGWTFGARRVRVSRL